VPAQQKVSLIRTCQDCRMLGSGAAPSPFHCGPSERFYVVDEIKLLSTRSKVGGKVYFDLSSKVLVRRAGISHELRGSIRGKTERFIETQNFGNAFSISLLHLSLLYYLLYI
jgi:hypothetical protein